jgi:hypothetical protein
MPATEMRTAEVPKVYARLSTAIGAGCWQGAVTRQEEAIRSNQFLREHLQYEYEIAYQLEKLRKLIVSTGTVPYEVCNDPSIFPSLGFAAQVLEVLDRSSVKQAKAFVKRVRNAFNSSEEMHGLRLELLAATHFIWRGHVASWHRKANEGSHDLLIEDLGQAGLEVECKSISEDKGRRIHRRDALDFWGELWKDVADVARGLRSGVAVVLTVPYRLPIVDGDRRALAREVVARFLAGNGAILNGGASVRVTSFDPASILAADGKAHDDLRAALDKATGTTNREVAVYKTPAGGIMAFVMQSAVEDDVLDQVFSTLDESAARQFSKTRGALFWVALQGLSWEQIVSLHKRDSAAGGQPSGLKQKVSEFLDRAPEHVIGVVFSSRSALRPTVHGTTGSGGVTNFFVKEKSPHWHASFRKPLALEN